MKAYFISGLGCDRRIFGRVSLPSGYDIVYIDWITPLENESLENYVYRLSEPIDITEPFVLAGLSFGGMAAVEISKFKKPVKLFLISSVAQRKELPLSYKIAGTLNLDKIIPVSWLKRPWWLLHYLFGPLDQDTGPMFDEIVRQTDPTYLKWAVGVITRWKNNYIPSGLVRIHGRHDRIFAFPRGEDARIIGAGGHLCVFSNSSEVNKVFEKELPRYQATLIAEVRK